MMLGVISIALGYLAIAPITMLEGGIICALMMTFSKLFCSRRHFHPFYPKDVTAELEADVGAFTPIFRKMSLVQMNAFMTKQIKAPENELLLHLLAEYIKYIFTVMPDKNDILLSKEEINEVLERVELNISKFQRGR